MIAVYFMYFLNEMKISECGTGAEYQLNASITMKRGKGEEREEGRNGAEKGERREGMRWEVKHKEGRRKRLRRGTRQHWELRAPVRVHRSLY